VFVVCPRPSLSRLCRPSYCHAPRGPVCAHRCLACLLGHRKLQRLQSIVMNSHCVHISSRSRTSSGRGMLAWFGCMLGKEIEIRACNCPTGPGIGAKNPTQQKPATDCATRPTSLAAVKAMAISGRAHTSLRPLGMGRSGVSQKVAFIKIGSGRWRKVACERQALRAICTAPGSPCAHLEHGPRGGNNMYDSSHNSTTIQQRP
jgi:hypothetical protein